MTAKKGSNFFLILLSSLFILISLFFLLNRSAAKTIPCANTLSCKESLELSIRNDEKAIFNGREFDPPKISLSDFSSEVNVLGTETGVGEKHIYVDLTTQTLKAYQGDTLFLETKVSTGKWFPSPTGEFSIWSKYRATLMSGGEGNDYYYLPNVPYVMYFYNAQISQGRGFALHGAYWHDNFGHAMSHGCINMRTIDAQEIFYWSDPDAGEKGSATAKKGEGTKITIYGEAP